MLKTLLPAMLATGVSIMVAQAANTRPNVVFIVADDMRADAIHAFGNDAVRTPNLDRLVDAGCTFTQVYTMGSTTSSVGVSSRAVMLSGRSLYRFGGDVSSPDMEMPLLPEILRNRGYATFATGKWSNGTNWFQRSFSHGDEIFFGIEGNHEGLRVHDYNSAGEYPLDSSHRIASYSSETFAKAAVKFLESRPRGIPFFAYVSFTAPRAPHTPPGGYVSMAPPVPENFRRQHPFDNGALNEQEEKHLVVPRVPSEVQDELARYYSMINHLDAQIGAILDALDMAGVMDNTIVVFTSDNGLAIGSHGLLGKQNLYEHSLRVPLILKGPGIPRHQQYLSLCYQMDVYPTICDLTGIPVPEAVEGKSLTPILNAQAGHVRNTLFGAYTDTQRSIRDYRFKMIYYPQIDHYQLFNLRSDPHETHDLFQSGEHGRDINRLRIQMAAWQSSLDDPLR